VWGWMKELVYNVKVATRDELLGRILDAADQIRNSQLKRLRATRAVHNRAGACMYVIIRLLRSFRGIS